MKTILILCTYQSLIFAFFLFIFSRPEERSRRILGLFFLFQFLHNSARLCLELNQSLYVFAELMTFPVAFMLFPLFNAYVRSMVGRTRNEINQVLHFAPAIVFLIIYLPLYLSMPEHDKQAYFQMSYLDILLHGARQYPAAIVAAIGLFLIVPLQTVVYSVDSIRSLLNHRRHLTDNFSSYDSKTLTWLLVLTVLFCAVAFSGILMISTGSEKSEELYFIVSLISFGGIGLFGSMQPQLYPETPAATMILPDCQEPPAASIPVPSGTPPTETPLNERLAKYFEEYHPHLDPDLSINDVARALGTNKTYISRALNDGNGTNFYTFINKHRVDEAKKKLREPGNDRFSIEGIAVESGFRSLSAFYAAFKMSEGVTPAAFRRKAG